MVLCNFRASFERGSFVKNPLRNGRAYGSFNLGHFQVGSCRYWSLIEGLYTLNSPPVVSFSLRALLKGLLFKESFGVQRTKGPKI